MCVISEQDVKEMYIRGQSDDPAVICGVSFKPGLERSKLLIYDFYDFFVSEHSAMPIRV